MTCITIGQIIHTILIQNLKITFLCILNVVLFERQYKNYKLFHGFQFISRHCRMQYLNSFFKFNVVLVTQQNQVTRKNGR